MQVIFYQPPFVCCIVTFGICVLIHYLNGRFYYFHMFRNPVNQFMHLNPLPTVKTFTWTGAERHA